MVEIKEKSKVIRRVPATDRAVTLLAGVGCMLLWYGISTVSMQETVPAWLRNVLGPFASADNSVTSVVLGGVVLALALAIWIYGLRRPVAFELNRHGITVHDLIETRMVPWHNIVMLERRIGCLVLHTSEDRKGFMRKPTIVFPVNHLDMTSSEIEGLITYHRPDLLTAVSATLKSATHVEDEEPADAAEAGARA